MSVAIMTSEPIPDSLFPRWQKLSLWVRETLRLDAIPELKTDPTTERETTVTIFYDRPTADAADCNDGFLDVEGEVVALVKECLGLAEVKKVVKKVDLTLA